MLDNVLGAMLTVVNDQLKFSLINIHKNSENNLVVIYNLTSP